MYRYGERAFLKWSAGCLCHITGGSAVLIHMEKGCISVGLRKGERGPRMNPMTAHVMKHPTYTFVHHHYEH